MHGAWGAGGTFRGSLIQQPTADCEAPGRNVQAIFEMPYTRRVARDFLGQSASNETWALFRTAPQCRRRLRI